MKLQDTIDLMNSIDFKDRIKAEYYQLKIRYNGLQNMLKKYKEGTLEFIPNCSYDLLHTQLVYMKLYIDILEERARIENIYLEGEDE